MILLKQNLILAFPIVLSCVLIRSVTVSRTDLVPETDSDGGEECDYIQIDRSGNSSGGRVTILSFDTMNMMKSFMVKTARRDVRLKDASTSLREKKPDDDFLRMGFSLNYNTLTR